MAYAFGSVSCLSRMARVPEKLVRNRAIQ
jgi:hypothetical protein